MIEVTTTKLMATTTTITTIIDDRTITSLNERVTKTKEIEIWMKMLIETIIEKVVGTTIEIITPTIIASTIDVMYKP